MTEPASDSGAALSRHHDEPARVRSRRARNQRRSLMEMPVIAVPSTVAIAGSMPSAIGM
jgi:hypothetical protein